MQEKPHFGHCDETGKCMNIGENMASIGLVGLGDCVLSEGLN